MTKTIFIGTYDLGAESVDLYARAGTGAEFSTRSGTKDQRQRAGIWVGMDYPEWHQVVGSVLHEAKEACHMRMGTRLLPDIDYSRDSGGYYFFETHAQHSELCGRVGYFLAQCLPALGRAWKRWQKEGKCKP